MGRECTGGGFRTFLQELYAGLEGVGVTDQVKNVTSRAGDKLVLSIFPGVDLLGRAFEEAGFCVVRGPDLIFGGDIRRFHPPIGAFWGIIGGPPCQDFSGLRRAAPTGYGLEMLEEYRRVVTEAEPEWWLMENVARVPNCDIAGYVTQRLDVNQAWFTNVSRLRHIQFGSKSGRLLNVTRRVTDVTTRGRFEGAALANDGRSFAKLCQLQGLPEGYDLPGFLVSEKKRAVGNGVPLPMGRALAQAVIEAYGAGVVVQFDLLRRVTPVGVCACGCGRPVEGKARYYDFSCRKRAQRQRERRSVTELSGKCDGPRVQV
jgi:DNA (cytosine-5)-methyltransferase 1